MNLNLSTLLDVAISLVFVFFVLSIFVSGIVELISAFLDKRSEILKLALIKLLGSQLFTEFWNHKQVKIKEQRLGGFLKPISYLSADSFSTVVIDLLKQKTSVEPSDTPASGHSLATVHLAVRETAFRELRDILEPILTKSETFTDFKQNLERWYDGYMEQVTGWYKRYMQGIIWAVAILVTLFFNIDTIQIAKRVFNDKTLRANLVDQAEQTAKRGLQGPGFSADANFITFLQQRDSALKASLVNHARLTGLDTLRIQDIYMQYLQDNLDALGLPIGWTFEPKARFGDHVIQIGQAFASWSLLGWLLTATALSFGAPFWFDLLLKLVNIRNVTKKPASSAPTVP